MRYSGLLAAAFAASASAAASGEKMYTLETAPGKTVVVTEDEKFQMIDVSSLLFPASLP